MSYSRDSLVHRLFEAQSRRTPDAVALRVPAAGRGGATRAISYRELDARADDVAQRLRRAGVGAREHVAVLLERSPEMIVALLAILKAEAAYVPLDRSYPRERLDFMLANTRARVLLTRRELVDEVDPAGAAVLCIEDDGAGDPRAVAAPPSLPLEAGDPAYVIYTSGSTGRPKGVLVPHRGIVRLVLDTDYTRFDATRVILQLAPISFDAATFEIWGALLHGGCCVLYPESGVPDLMRLGEVVRETGVTTLWLTASLFNMVIDQAPQAIAGVAEVLTGGEALSVPHVRRALALLPGAQLVNGYGPTESTTFACCYRIPRELPADLRSIPIGTPIAHTTVRLLDVGLQPVRAGDDGDLYIGGDGLAIGYLNRPELTAERFIVAADGERLYRTGDRARRLDDGTIEFLGRLDDQVKIRGHRVELGEIETTLRTHPAIGDAVVLLREDAPGDKRLAAYYSARPDSVEPSGSVLRQYLGQRLPEYMIPSHFVALREIPLTPNGKADRYALPAPGRRRPDLDRPLLAPRTPLEAWLATHWCELLNLGEVGVHDRFFELGGSSITAMRLLARLSQDAGKPLPTLILFRAPTIAEMATILETEFAALLPSTLLPAGTERPAPLPVADALARQRDELIARRARRRFAG